MNGIKQKCQSNLSKMPKLWYNWKGRVSWRDAGQKQVLFVAEMGRNMLDLLAVVVTIGYVYNILLVW